jgi:hypothetical protein
MASAKEGGSTMIRLLRIWLLFAVGSFMSACTTYALPSDSPNLAHGNNTVIGSARLIYSAHDFIRDCDGQDVYLIPARPDVVSRMTQAFGSPDNSFVSGRMQDEFLDKSDRDVSRRAECSDGGKFRFADVPDGSYYVFARIMWLIGHGQNAGNLAAVINVAHGETKTLDLKKTFDR